MDKPLLIWTPVISAQLKNRRIKSTAFCSVEKNPGHITDIKIKIRQCEARLQGTSVHIWFQLEYLCLMEGHQGEMLLITWTGECQDRITLTEFDSHGGRWEKTDMKIDIIEHDGEGEVKEGEICLDFYIDYSVIASQDKIIEISPARQSETAVVSLKAALQKLEEEFIRVEGENGDLRRRLFIYERDISSLKRGLWKAENRNATLNREKKEHQALIEKLSAITRNQGTDAGQTKGDHPLKAVDNRPALQPEELTRWGGRLKRMFMNGS
jgi:hypothetical protein